MKISVITTLFYGEKYISDLIKCIEDNINVISNESEDIQVEYVFINDSPKQQIKDISSDLFDTKIYNNEINMGIHKSRVKGLEIATGDYILFLDQDDKIKNNFMLEMGKKAKERFADVIIANAIIEDEHGKHIFYTNEYAIKCATKFRPYYRINNQIFSPGQCLIKKESIPDEWKEYHMKNNGADDYFLWILMFSKKKVFTYLNKCLYIHCYTGENLSYNLDKMLESTMEMLSYISKVPYVSGKIINNVFRYSIYKNKFRKENRLKKILISIKYFGYALDNVFYRLKCKL